MKIHEFYKRNIAPFKGELEMCINQTIFLSYSNFHHCWVILVPTQNSMRNGLKIYHVEIFNSMQNKHK